MASLGYGRVSSQNHPILKGKHEDMKIPMKRSPIFLCFYLHDFLICQMKRIHSAKILTLPSSCIS